MTADRAIRWTAVLAVVAVAGVAGYVSYFHAVEVVTSNGETAARSQGSTRSASTASSSPRAPCCSTPPGTVRMRPRLAWFAARCRHRRHARRERYLRRPDRRVRRTVGRMARARFRRQLRTSDAAGQSIREASEGGSSTTNLVTPPERRRSCRGGIAARHAGRWQSVVHQRPRHKLPPHPQRGDETCAPACSPSPTGTTRKTQNPKEYSREPDHPAAARHLPQLQDR